MKKQNVECELVEVSAEKMEAVMANIKRSERIKEKARERRELKARKRAQDDKRRKGQMDRCNNPLRSNPFAGLLQK